jgi:hypothetical protein
VADPFRDFDTEYTVRKAVEGQGSMQNVLPSTVAVAIGDALAKQVAPVAEALDAMNKRLDRLEDGRS